MTKPTREPPPYVRIMTDIAERISRAELRPGDLLPTRSELSRQFGAARATIDKALGELSRQGLIESGSGRRTVVVGGVPRSPVVSTIGVLWHWPLDQQREGADYLDLLFRGIREACAEFMLQVHFRSAPLHTYGDLIRTTGAQGLLVVRPDYSDTGTIDAIHAAGVPVVVVPGVLDESKAPSISSDNAAAIDSAVQHLVGLGHRELGFVGLTATVPDHFERLKAFLAACAKRGLSVNPDWLLIAHEKNPALFREHLADWLTPRHHPTAIIASDFMMTLSVMGRLRELALDIPREVSLVTFDDPPAAAQMHPPLTAVHQPVPRLGSRAIERLRELIQGQDVPHVDRVGTQLIVRDSTAPPRHAL